MEEESALVERMEQVVEIKILMEHRSITESEYTSPSPPPKMPHIEERALHCPGRRGHSYSKKPLLQFLMVIQLTLRHLKVEHRQHPYKSIIR